MPIFQYDRHALHCDLDSVSSNSHNSMLPTSWIICFDSGLKGFNDWFCRSACVLRAPHQLITVRLWRRTRGRTPFHPSHIAGLGTARFVGPSASRNTFAVSTITDGNVRIGGRSHLPALTLAWLYTEPSPCGGVRPAGDLVDSDPGVVFEDDPHPRSDAGRPLEDWVCRHTREPTVLSRVSCRPPHLNFDRFHQPCLIPGRTSRMGEDCRPRTTWRPLTLAGSPALPFASHWRFFATPTRRWGRNFGRSGGGRVRRRAVGRRAGGVHPQPHQYQHRQKWRVEARKSVPEGWGTKGPRRVGAPSRRVWGFWSFGLGGLGSLGSENLAKTLKH